MRNIICMDLEIFFSSSTTFYSYNRVFIFAGFHFAVFCLCFFIKEIVPVKAGIYTL
jgi:hypothetical protein